MAMLRRLFEKTRRRLGLLSRVLKLDANAILTFRP